MCYYCEFGLPPKVKAIFDAVEQSCPGIDVSFGPGHIVYSDFNFDDECISHCIKAHDNTAEVKRLHPDWPAEELAASRKGLVDLLALSPEDRHLPQCEAFNESE